MTESSGSSAAMIATRKVTVKQRSEWQRKYLNEQAVLGYALLVPAVAVLLLLIGYPAISGVYYSFTNKMIGFKEPHFIGIDNYINLASNPAVWKAVGRSFIFAVSAVLVKLPLGMGVALLLNQVFFGRGLVRGVVLLPWSLPLVVGVLIWTWMYSDLFGIFNSLLMRAHLITAPINFLGDPKLALPSIIVTNIWRGFPFFAINILAGLQSIPGDRYEAGRVDGANRWQLFWNITVPGVSTVIMIVTLLSFIWTINDFTSPWILTKGGPGTATEVFPIITYKIAFFGLEIGKAAALPVMLLPIFGLLIYILTKNVAARENES